MLNKKVILNFFLICIIIGCSSPPDLIKPSYVSPLQFQNASCEQIKEEIVNVQKKVIEIADVQSTEATKDVFVTTFSLALFPPGLILLIGDENEVQFASLKGTYIALEDAAIQKGCDYAQEIIKSRKIEKEKERQREKEREQKEKNLRELYNY